MSTIRFSRVLARSMRLAGIRHTQVPQPVIFSRQAHQDYGSGDGHPVGENPQHQGANPSADKEHPGPPPPKAGHGSGSSPTKGTSGGHNTNEAKQSSTKEQSSK